MKVLTAQIASKVWKLIVDEALNNDELTPDEQLSVTFSVIDQINLQFARCMQNGEEWAH